MTRLFQKFSNSKTLANHQILSDVSISSKKVIFIAHTTLAHGSLQ